MSLMPAQILYGREDLIPSFRDALDVVAKENIYLELTESPPLDEVHEFQMDLIHQNLPTFYAVKSKTVIGWADISPFPRPRLSHRGRLGMGIIPSERGKGLGSKLLQAALDHAKTTKLEKVELSVYTFNDSAIRLYRKCGFTDIGTIRQYRKMDGRYFDSLEMELFLKDVRDAFPGR